MLGKDNENEAELKLDAKGMDGILNEEVRCVLTEKRPFEATLEEDREVSSIDSWAEGTSKANALRQEHLCCFQERREG